MSIFNNSKRKKAILRIRSGVGKNAHFEILFLKTNLNLYVQLVDLKSKITICSLSTTSFIKKNTNGRSIQNATILGEKFAKKCLENKINELPYLNRASYLYHGIVDAFYVSFKNNFVVK